MKICPECNKNEIDEKYFACKSCVDKEKTKRLAEQLTAFKGVPDLIKENRENTNAILNSLSQLNNNLYALRTQNDYFLSKNKKILFWDKDKAKFVIKNAKKPL